MRLKRVETVEITPKAPFNFDATFHKPDHFTSGDNYWEKGIRWQTWLWDDKSLGLKFINSGSVNEPKLKIEVYYSKKLPQQFLNSLIEEVNYRYNLELDLNGFYKKFKDDPALKPLFKILNGMRPGHPSSLYEYLIIGIILQNLFRCLGHYLKNTEHSLITTVRNFGVSGKKVDCQKQLSRN